MEELINYYKEFVVYASQTQDMDSNSLSDFIGFILNYEE